jgi:hypothetical protein
MNAVRFFILSALPLLVTQLATAQGRSAGLLIDVRWVGGGMAWPQGGHLYLRVHSNGRVEYEDGKLDGARSRFLVRRARLSASEINSLSDFLTSSGVKSLATEYPPVNTPVDHFIIVSIQLPRGRESQTIKIVNFFPMSPKDSEAYPTALVQLLCKIERLRNGASFGITADRTEWCY